MGKSSFFNDPVAYDVIQEGGEGSSFFGDGPAYTEIDPVAIENFVKKAADSADASEVSNNASKAQADASAASAATATTQAEIATMQAGIATSKASDASTSAAAALASQNAAKTSETNAKTSETNAKTSETNAGNSATAAAGSGSTASTKAGDAATSAAAALASQNASKTSETNSKTSETNAAASATAANTSKVNAGTSETNAAASAAAALASKNAAANSETNAASSATAAAGSATTASTQAGNAATSATSAASSLTSFKAVWCGNAASDPSVNGNGGALTAGCLYWNTTGSTLKIYNGSAWINYSAVSVATVFGRSGTVTAQTGDYTFAQIGSKPTTLSGYGITDALASNNPNFTGVLSLSGLALFGKSSGFTVINNGDGSLGSIALGPATDKTNYYRNDKHIFQNAAVNVTYATIDSTAALYSVPWKSNVSPTSAWALDTTGVVTTTKVAASGGTAVLPVGSGLVCLGDNDVTGAIAMFLCGGGAVTLIATTNSIFTNTVTAGKVSLTYDATVNGSSGGYKITNSYTSPIGFSVTALRMRSGN